MISPRNIWSIRYFMTHSRYNLRKSKRVLKTVYDLYKNKWKTLSLSDLDSVEQQLETLDQAVTEKKEEEASELAQKLEEFAQAHLKKTIFDHLKEMTFAIITALIIATIIRQMWFEPMEIPTGSMRPTFKQKDRLLVSKSAFGLNVPLLAEHFSFDPTLLDRTSIIVFRPENMDMQNTDTTYFGIPGKKRYIKRCMGKPGDTLYFYGGKIYGIDKEGNDLPELRNAPCLEGLEHIPFINLEGKVISSSPDNRGLFSPVFFYHMNHHIAKLSVLSNGKTRGEFFSNKTWKEETHPKRRSKTNEIQSYSDYWGIKNYAMARLLTKKELDLYSNTNSDDVAEGVLYLELRHNPSLAYPTPKIIQDVRGHIRPALSSQTSIIPLKKEHLQEILNNIYTVRFVVKDGYATRYSPGSEPPSKHPVYPQFPKVPDGTYEFYYGKAYQIGFEGNATELKENHPLYNNSPKHIQKLFNLGIEMLTPYAPHDSTQTFAPSRYAYYRNGDLYLMGAPIFKSNDPTLLAFQAKEQKLLHKSPPTLPFIPFTDNGPPLKEDGSIDVEIMNAFGLKIPEKMYLAVGDNHAQSSDSRIFGFVPEDNIRGSAGPILWPPSPRWGSPPQPEKNCMVKSNFIIWGIATTIALGCALYTLRQRNRPIFKKQSK